MPPPFRIVGGFVDLDAAVVVRPSGRVGLSPAEILLLSTLQQAGTDEVELAALGEALWPLAGRTDRIEPLLWSLRRKLAPAHGLLERTEGGVRLVPVDEPLRVEQAFVAVVSTEYGAAGPDPAIERVEPHLWVSSRAAPLVAALEAIPTEVPLRVVIDVVHMVGGERELALQAAMGRLRGLQEEAWRILLTEPVMHALQRPVRRVGRWLRPGREESESLWTVDGPAADGVLAPMLDLVDGPSLAGREEEGETCWAAIRAGASTVLIHGPEGSGRTTLLEALAAQAPTRLGRAWHVRTVHLGGVVDEAGLVDRLARGLEIAPKGRVDEAVGRALRSLSPLVLLVDDLDHASPEVIRDLGRWRQRASRCTLVATSRKPLRLPGALWVGLKPLSVQARRRVLHRHTRELSGWESLSEDDAVLTALVEEVGGAPAALQVLIGRTRFMGPDLLLATVRMERVGASRAPERAIVDMATSRVSRGALEVLDRIACFDRRLSFEDVEAACDDVPGAALEILRELVEAGLIHHHEDRVLLEPWFSVSNAVRTLRAGTLSEERRAQVFRRVDRSVAARAQRWADALDAGGEDVRLARRIERLVPAFEQALARVWLSAQARLNIARVLMVPWEQGRFQPATLLAYLDAIELPQSATLALLRSRVACDLGQMERIRVELAGIVEAEGAERELAIVLKLDADHVPAAQARPVLAEISEALLTPRGDRVSLLPEILDSLLVSGSAADVVEIADRHASLASSRGSRWRTAQLALQGFRARAGLGRLRPTDLRVARLHLQALRDVHDHRRFAAGLQWVSRALVASGDPSGGLAWLDRSLAMIDAHGPWSVRHMTRIDRARARQLVGDLDGAAQSLDAFDELQAIGPRLPAFVASFDRLLLAVGRRDAAAIRRHAADIGAGGMAHHRLASLLLGLADRFGEPGEWTVPPVKNAAERALLGVVRAAREGDEGGLAQARQRLNRMPEWRSIALIGVVLRAIDGALDSGDGKPDRTVRA